MTLRPFLLIKFLHSKLRLKTLDVELKQLSDRPLEFMGMLSGELNLRLSQVKDSLMNILQVQISRAINSAINDRVIPEIQNAMDTLSSRQRDIESGSSPNNHEDREGSNRFKIKISKTDSTSALVQETKRTFILTPASVRKFVELP